MSKNISLQADARTLFGRKTKQLRKQGVVPANIFGRDFKSVAIQVNKRDFIKVYNEVGETGIVDLQVEKKTLPVLISDMHMDPVSEDVLHVDFRHVNLKQKITANVPLEAVGEAPAVKEKNAVFVQNLDEIEVEALPTDLPDQIEIDLSKLVEIGDVITVADLKVSDKVEILADPETVVAGAQEQQEEEVEEAPTEAAAEGEAAAPSEGGEAEKAE